MITREFKINDLGDLEQILSWLEACWQVVPDDLSVTIVVDVPAQPRQTDDPWTEAEFEVYDGRPADPWDEGRLQTPRED